MDRHYKLPQTIKTVVWQRCCRRSTTSWELVAALSSQSTLQCIVLKILKTIQITWLLLFLSQSFTWSHLSLTLSDMSPIKCNELETTTETVKTVQNRSNKFCIKPHTLFIKLHYWMYLLIHYANSNKLNCNIKLALTLHKLTLLKHFFDTFGCNLSPQTPQIILKILFLCI